MPSPVLGAVGSGMSEVEPSPFRCLKTNCVFWYLVDILLVYHMEGLLLDLIPRPGFGFVHMQPFSPNFMINMNFCDAWLNSTCSKQTRKREFTWIEGPIEI